MSLVFLFLSLSNSLCFVKVWVSYLAVVYSIKGKSENFVHGKVIVWIDIDDELFVESLKSLSFNILKKGIFFSYYKSFFNS